MSGLGLKLLEDKEFDFLKNELFDSINGKVEESTSTKTKSGMKVEHGVSEEVTFPNGRKGHQLSINGDHPFQFELVKRYNSFVNFLQENPEQCIPKGKSD